MGAPALGDVGAVTRALVGTLQALYIHAACSVGVGEQPAARAAVRGKGAAVAAQQLEQRHAQDAVAIRAALARVDAHAHSVCRAVDVAHAQGAHLGHAQPAGVDGLQCHATGRLRAAGKQARNLLAREQVRLPLGYTRHRRAHTIALAQQHRLEQKPAGAGNVIHAAVGELAVLDQVQQVCLDLGGAQQIRTAVVVQRHPGDGAAVALFGALGQPANGHGVKHALTKGCHEVSPLNAGGHSPALKASPHRPGPQATRQIKTPPPTPAHQPPRQRFSST